MISPKKLASLPRKTRLRKLVNILEQWERELSRGEEPLPAYAAEILDLLAEERKPDEDIRRQAVELAEAWRARESGSSAVSARAEGTLEGLLRMTNGLKHRLMERLGLSPGDWDFYDPESRTFSRPQEGVFPLRIYLDDIRSPFNVGAVFRSAEAFGAQRIFVSPHCARPDHRRALRTSMGSAEILPWETRDIEELSAGETGTVFALEIGGTPIREFSFPREGTVVLGSEELGLSPEARRLAESDGGIVSIPLSGGKASLNAAVAFGILMEHWRSSLG
jgi:RNA methyltransferase, TrmH family